MDLKTDKHLNCQVFNMSLDIINHTTSHHLRTRAQGHGTMVPCFRIITISYNMPYNKHHHSKCEYNQVISFVKLLQSNVMTDENILGPTSFAYPIYYLSQNSKCVGPCHRKLLLKMLQNK